jgi:tryptophan synthase beta subunit
MIIINIFYNAIIITLITIITIIIIINIIIIIIIILHHQYLQISDKQALEAFFEISKTEGIIPALEPSHALYETMQIAKSLGKDKDVLVNLCGRGDKDMMTVAKIMGVKIN